MPHDYYNLRGHYNYESQKQRVLDIPLVKWVEQKKIKLVQKHFFYNLNEKYVNDNEKPKAPNYSFGRPKTFFYDSKNRNKIRPKSTVNINEKEKNTSGPGRYDVTKEFGKDGIKIGISKYGRKYEKSIQFPRTDILLFIFLACSTFI